MKDKFMNELLDLYGYKIVKYDQLQEDIIKDRVEPYDGDYVLYDDMDKYDGWCVRDSDIDQMLLEWAQMYSDVESVSELWKLSNSDFHN